MSVIGSACRRLPWLAYGVAGGKVKAALLALALSLAPPAAAEDARQAPVEVVMLGDSLTQGYGLLPEEGLVMQLQGWLDTRGVPARLVNAGVSGDTSAGGAARVDWALSDGADALIVALGGNDLLRGLDPAETRANLDRILQAAASRELPVLLVGLSAPGNYGSGFKADFEAIFPDLAQAHDALLVADMLAPLRDRAEEPGAMAKLMQPDGLHPSAEGVALIAEHLGPQVRALVARAGDDEG